MLRPSRELLQQENSLAKTDLFRRMGSLLLAMIIIEEGWWLTVGTKVSSKVKQSIQGAQGVRVPRSFPFFRPSDLTSKSARLGYKPCRLCRNCAPVCKNPPTHLPGSLLKLNLVAPKTWIAPKTRPEICPLIISSLTTFWATNTRRSSSNHDTHPLQHNSPLCTVTKSS